MKIKPKSILLVYNNDTLIDEIKNNILEENYTLIIADTIEKAVEEAVTNLPNIIISESIIDNESGVDLCRRIRRNNKTRYIPFIIVTESKEETKRIEALEEGADAYLITPINHSELKAHMKSKIKMYREMYLLSITDELTNLYNRKEFLKKFKEITEKNPKEIMSIAMLDIDHFKQVNDKYGHQMGDEVLMQFAKLLLEYVNKGIFPTRFGGEEFAVLIPEKRKAETKIIFEEILEKFTAINFTSIAQESFRVTFSSGISEYPNTSNDLSSLLSRADQALYSAKKDGRNRVYIYQPYMAHNDRFWEFFEKTSGFYLDSEGNDSITKKPFLPKLLEIFSETKDQINSIGVINIYIDQIYNFRDFYGNSNYDYVIQNIVKTIESVSISHFASDTYIAVSRYMEYGFSVYFPSLFNFSLNKDKCLLLYHEIISDIENKLKKYPFALSYSYGIIYNDPVDQKLFLSESIKISKDIFVLNNKSVFYSFLTNSYDNIVNLLEKNFKESIYISTKTGKNCFSSYISDGITNECIELDIFAFSFINTEEKLKNYIYYLLKKASTSTIIIPWVATIDLQLFINHVNVLNNKSKKIIIQFNEYSVKLQQKLFLKDFETELDTISFAISNCYISTDSLRLITINNFKYVFFSKYLFKKIHYYKKRIKVIKGLIQFIDQLGIKTAVEDISNENELHYIKGLNIDYISGKQDIISE